MMEQADVPFNRADRRRRIDFRQQIQLSFCAHKKNGGERGEAGRSEASSPFSLSLFLSNGGLTLVQRRVSFGEKWHERSEGGRGE